MFRPLMNGQVPMLRGDLYRATHQASVDAILGANVRRVYSRGSSFYNRDFWPLRVFVVQFCAWVSRNPGIRPTRDDIARLVDESNLKRVTDPHIVIAATPVLLTFAVARALTGGSYHEAWHTLYSRRNFLSHSEVWFIINAVWDLIEDTHIWARLATVINTLANVVEDIRIERNGNKQYPGAEPNMEDLQDFILEQEESNQVEASHRGIPAKTLNATYRVVVAVFRDVGLGYSTDRQHRAMAGYKEANPAAVQFVLTGPLAGLLRESIRLGPKDDTACLRIAMEMIAAIYNATKDANPEEKDEKESKDAPPQNCHNCGAPPTQLHVRPKTDDLGLQIDDEHVLVCAECGFEEDVTLSDGKDGKGTPVQGEKGEKGEKGAKPEKADQVGEPGDGEPQPVPGEGETGGEAEPGDEKSEGGNASVPGTGVDEVADGAKIDDDKDKSPRGAGGHKWEEGPQTFWNDTAMELLNQAASNPDPGIIDNNSALESAVAGAKAREDSDCHKGERPFRPFDRTDDTVAFVEPSGSGKDIDNQRAQRIMASVKSQCSYLRARLRSIVRAAEQVSTEHGTRRGLGISERRFTEDRAELMAGQVPSRPCYDRDEDVDTSFAAVVIMDQSSSMDNLLVTATQAFMALIEPLDALGCATMAIGFRDGAVRNPISHPDSDIRGTYHRRHPVHIDVFKAFGEKFQTVKWRFANTRAVGGTPMADGIQLGLETLSGRPEAHRVVFVVTDGLPNGGHAEVMVRQTRIAKESGIRVVGIGLGEPSRGVMSSFPDHVFAPSLQQLPLLLIGKLNEIMDFRKNKRGLRLKTTS